MPLHWPYRAEQAALGVSVGGGEVAETVVEPPPDPLCYVVLVFCLHGHGIKLTLPEPEPLSVGTLFAQGIHCEVLNWLW